MAIFFSFSYFYFSFISSYFSFISIFVSIFVSFFSFYFLFIIFFNALRGIGQAQSRVRNKNSSPQQGKRTAR